MKNKEILIIGRPNSTKTTFLAQFYSKLLNNSSTITLYKSVENISAIEDARKRLSQGESTQSTPTEKNVELILPLKIDDKQIDLICPDYGGEQINEIIDQRIVNKKWLKAIRNSDHWILFIRPNNITMKYDLSNKTMNKDIINDATKDSENKFELSDQSRLIELLQIMLDKKGNNLHIKNNKVKISIILTCWDELKLDKDETPEQELNKRLPLLLNFIDTNWEKSFYNIMGLSAQGFELTSENKEKYLDDGPENFCYCVDEEGNKSNDITLIVSGAL